MIFLRAVKFGMQSNTLELTQLKCKNVRNVLVINRAISIVFKYYFILMQEL